MKIKIIIANPEEGIVDKVRKQANVEVCYESGVENISDFFNDKFLELPRYDVYGFLMDSDNFVSSDALSKFIEHFERDMQYVGVVYSDKFLIKESVKIYQIYPQYEAESRTIYNPTIFVNGHINARIFRSDLTFLRTYDAIQKLGQVTKVIHIPEPLITSRFISNNIKEELERYVRQSN